MLRAGLRFGLSCSLVAFSIPLLAVSFVIAALCAAMVAVLPGFLKHRDRHAIALKKLRPVDEFAFEESVQAYEELIGAHAWRRP